MVSLKKPELIEHLLKEADGYPIKDDAVQSSEKLYKAAEGYVKMLAERFGLEEVKVTEERGKWTISVLEKAVRKLTDKLGLDVQLGWDAANYLHVWGFHEAKLDVEDVEARMLIIRRLVGLMEKIG